MNKILTPGERRALQTRAHLLRPVVMIGAEGLTAAVLQEIDGSLKAHELIKIKADVEDPDEREDLMGIICANTGASAIQHIGKMLVVFRERPQGTSKNNGSANASQPPRRNASAAPSGARKAVKRPGGPVWTKARQQRGRKGSKPG